MSCPKHKQTILADTAASRLLSKIFSINMVKFGLATLCLTFATASMAEWNDNPPTETVYVDSILKWGAWELDIEPAAGGITPASRKALNARDPKVSFRINSIAALAPNTQPVAPAAAPAPVPPTIPTIRPISPSVPVPVGGPADGF
jgi:hypothetical protein